jgi:hypothetical protein
VCRGPYPAAFVKAWKAWDKRHKSENDAIGDLPDGQLYAVFAMANCGRDLESYQLQGYEQVRSLLLQVRLPIQARTWAMSAHEVVAGSAVYSTTSHKKSKMCGRKYAAADGFL